MHEKLLSRKTKKKMRKIWNSWIRKWRRRGTVARFLCLHLLLRPWWTILLFSQLTPNLLLLLVCLLYARQAVLFLSWWLAICNSHFLKLMPTLWTFGVNLSPLYQTNLMIKMATSSINKMIFINSFIQTNRTFIFCIINLNNIFKMVIFVFVPVLWKWIRIVIWLIYHYFIQLPFPFCNNPLLYFKAS